MSDLNQNTVSHIADSHDPSKSFVAKVIAWSIANQLIVLMLSIALGVAGWIALKNTPLDAIVYVWHEFCLHYF